MKNLALIEGFNTM